MAEARAGRALCARCARPGIACLCAWACAIANEIPLLILQHPLEQDHPKGSAKLLQLSLAQVRLEVGECFDPVDLATWLQPRQAGPTVLLYPLAPGVPQADQHQHPGLLVLIDATWKKSLRMLHANPALQALPRWALTAPPASRYVVRKAPRPAQRSSLEAAGLALGQLEAAPERYQPLLSAFDGLVASIAARRGGDPVRHAAAATPDDGKPPRA